MLVGVGLSGCLGDDSTPQANIQDPGVEPTFDDDTGAIQGQVLTLEQLPIAGALVVVVEDASKSTTTNEEGRFALSNLAPDDYTVAAQKIGYEPGVRRVTVVAGTTTDLIEIQLEPLPTTDPYGVLLDEQNALLSGVMWKLTPECVYTEVNTLAKTCGGLRLECDPADACEVHYESELKENWETIIGEVMWTPQSGATGRGFNFDLNAPNITRGQGGSISGDDPKQFSMATDDPPMQVRIDKSGLADLGIGEEDYCCDWFYRLFPAYCDLGNCEEGFGPDYGISYENRATVYISVWYNGPAPEGYSALPG